MTKEMTDLQLRQRMQIAWDHPIPDKWDALVATVTMKQGMGRAFDRLCDRLEAGHRIYP